MGASIEIKKFFFHFFWLKKKWKFFHFFWFKKIVAFAFHFLSDFSRQSKSKISFFPFVKILSRKNLLICFSLSLRFFSSEKIEDFLFYLFIDLACLKFASKVKIEKIRFLRFKFNLFSQPKHQFLLKVHFWRNSLKIR